MSTIKDSKLASIGKDEVSWVKHPSLKSHKGYKVASKLMPKGSGAIISFGLKGGKKRAVKFIESLKVSSGTR